MRTLACVRRDFSSIQWPFFAFRTESLRLLKAVGKSVVWCYLFLIDSDFQWYEFEFVWLSSLFFLVISIAFYTLLQRCWTGRTCHWCLLGDGWDWKMSGWFPHMPLHFASQGLWWKSSWICWVLEVVRKPIELATIPSRALVCMQLSSRQNVKTIHILKGLWWKIVQVIEFLKWSEIPSMRQQSHCGNHPIEWAGFAWQVSSRKKSSRQNTKTVQSSNHT